MERVSLGSVATREIERLGDATEETRILLVNDHLIVREGIRQLLETRQDLKVVEQASDGQQAVELAKRLRPDVVMMDISLPRLSAVEVTRRIVESGCGSRVLILALRNDRLNVEEILRAGASGCLLKESSPSEMFVAIDALRCGQSYLSPSVTQQVVEALGQPQPRSRSPLARLTEREREVLQLIAEGDSSKEIADRLGLAVKTIESHRATLMKKLGVHKASRLVLLAIRERLIAV